MKRRELKIGDIIQVGYIITSNHILYVFIRCFSYFIKYISFHFLLPLFIVKIFLVLHRMEILLQFQLLL
jgi:hypothetical protein